MKISAPTLTRRQALLGFGAFGALSTGLAATPALARELVKGFMDEMMAAGPVTVDWLHLIAPDEAENSNAVKIGVKVEPPAELGLHCEEVLIVLEKNPRPAACRMTFAAAGVPDFVTHLRLADSQDVMALARMSDGSVAMARKTVTLTVGGCGL